MISKVKSSTSGSAPRWSYIVGAIVAVGGLVWAIASFFITKPAPDVPAATAATPASVHVSGTGSVGIGTMSGGSITVGSAKDADKPDEATGASK